MEDQFELKSIEAHVVISGIIFLHLSYPRKSSFIIYIFRREEISEKVATGE